MRIVSGCESYWIFSDGIIPLDVIEDTEQVLHGLGTQHGDAGFLEVGDALEDG